MIANSGLVLSVRSDVHVRDDLANSLRTRRVRATECRDLFGADFAERHAHELELLTLLREDGLAEQADDGSVRVIANGRLLPRNIAMAFDACLRERRRSGGRLFRRAIRCVPRAISLDSIRAAIEVHSRRRNP